MTRAQQQKEWETRVADFLNSGQSATTWCAANDVKPHQLWYRVHKHRMEHDVLAENPAKWLAVEVGDNISGGILRVDVGRASVEVKPGFDPALLAAVVKTLVSLC
ncbi:Hypothetical protein DEACI_1438 [Acididesulfobacillus acetoxydans]|uniref:Transposase n=1 Tax=Acididesulfobacillus acetoxydans TaxID=1561005 RepID=A0A8S0Y2G7_9FIRM|nr:helix-turn-helix domain-containing protein [Acididesulfobacillus acetoxydans]CAA7600785.1 Hypothetical protein DEACI_1438 [Acididesulfobacillus acetoxydans]CEJ08633.1 Hypothetical protein DEACI_3112 [Acididesulfobacillus acetoxydans]